MLKYEIKPKYLLVISLLLGSYSLYLVTKLVYCGVDFYKVVHILILSEILLMVTPYTYKTWSSMFLLISTYTSSLLLLFACINIWSISLFLFVLTIMYNDFTNSFKRYKKIYSKIKDRGLSDFEL